MMISRAQIDQILRVYRTSAAGRTSAGAVQSDAGERSADALQISVSSQDVALVKSVVRKVPEVREDKVREISRKIKEGSYHVSSREIAEKLLGRLIADGLR